MLINPIFQNNNNGTRFSKSIHRHRSQEAHGNTQMAQHQNLVQLEKAQIERLAKEIEWAMKTRMIHKQ